MHSYFSLWLKRSHTISGLLLTIVLFHLTFTFTAGAVTSGVDTTQTDTTQVKESTPAGRRYLAYVPPAYRHGANSEKKYPLLVFLHGAGQSGDNLNDLFSEGHGIPAIIHEGRWPADRPFIVVSPQLSSEESGDWWATRTHEVITHIANTYRVDMNRIYVTGLSMGAKGTFTYALNYPEMVAAAVPIAGWSTPSLACQMKDVPTWAFIGDADTKYLDPTVDMINSINSCHPLVPARVNFYPGKAHEKYVWNGTYDGSNGYDIYSWMLQYAKHLPPPNMPPIADAGPDRSVSLPENSLILHGTAIDLDGSVHSYNWTQLSGPPASLAGTATPDLAVSGLSIGTYGFKFTVTDDDGDTTSDSLLVSVLSGEAIVWNSYDVSMRSTLDPQAVVYSDDLSLHTTVEFYQSANDFGVDKKALFSDFNPGSHPNSKSFVRDYWGNGTGNTFPYAGKSTVGRGSEAGEGNVPFPLGVLDLQLHPPNSNKLVVSAFVVPIDGNYQLSDLAVRRLSSSSGTVKYRIFNHAKEQIHMLTATNNQDWVSHSSVVALGALAAGDRIYFAVDRDGSYTSDFTEIAWTITKQGNPMHIPNQPPVANAGNDIHIYHPQDSVTVHGSANDIDGGVVSSVWEQLSGPQVLADTLTGPDLYLHDLITGTYTFRLTATDDNGEQGSDDVTVFVHPPSEVIRWSSYDISMLTSGAQAVVNSHDQSIPANVEFYQSTNDFGVNQGALLSTFNPGNHPNVNSKVSGYWAKGEGNVFPYAGKSTVGRGYEAGEGNVPSPSGVFDLQMHPPNNNKLIVSAFIAPEHGEYSLVDLGVRRVFTAKGTVTYRVFDNHKNPIVALQATNDQDWVMSGERHGLGTLSAGQKIYFAVDRDGGYGSDFTEVTWTVELTGPPSAARTMAEAPVESDTALKTSVIRMYPNPAKDVIHLDGVASGAHIKIYNSMEMLIEKFTTAEESDSMSINIESLDSGIYYLLIREGDQWQRFRFMKE